MLDSPLYRSARRWLSRIGHERSTAEHLPQYSHLQSSGPGIQSHVIRHIDGAVYGMFAVQGVSWEDLDAEELAAQHEALCELHRTLNLRARLTVHKFLVRTEATAADCPAHALPTPFTAEMDAAYRCRLVGEGHLYRNHLFLGALIRPPTIAGRWRRVQTQEVRPADHADVEALEHILGTIRADLGEAYGLVPLGLRKEGNLLYSEIAEALAFVLTGRRKKVPLPNGRLGRAICPHRPVFRNQTVELRYPGHTELAALFGYSVYPAGTDAAMYDALLAAPCRFSLSQSMGTMKLHRSQTLVTRRTNNMVAAGDPASTQIAELADAANELQQRQWGFGVHNITLAVFADDEASLRASAERMDDEMRSSGAIISRIDWDIEGAYFGLVPGAEGLHSRAAPIKTRNYAAHAPLHNYPSGWRAGRWCDHIAVFRTNGGTPYYFNMHTSEGGGPGEVPHARFTGPTRSGKTVAMLFLLAQTMDRAGAQAVLWDKDRGAKLAVIRLGGEYFEFKIGEDTGLAPLRALYGGKPAHLDFLTQLTTALIMSDGGPKLAAEEERRLALAVRMVMRMPVELRSFGEIRAFLGTEDDSAGARLRRWCRGEPLGWVVDNPRDRIRLDAQIVGFDQTDYLKHPIAVGPMQAYLFFRVGELADGRRLVVALDEVQESFQNAAARRMIANGLATFGKLNVAMWLSTQALGTLLEVPEIAHIVREQCLTSFDFPNGKALWADYEKSGFSRPAFDWVKSGLSGGGKGRFLLRQGESTVPAQLSLEGMDDVLAVLSGRKETVALFDEITAEMGEDADLDERFREFHRRRLHPEFQRRLRRAVALEEIAS